MKIIVDYEFKAKLHSEEELTKEITEEAYNEFVKKLDARMEDSVKELVLDSVSDEGLIVDVERISLNVQKV